MTHSLFTEETADILEPVHQLSHGAITLLSAQFKPDGFREYQLCCLQESKNQMQSSCTVPHLPAQE